MNRNLLWLLIIGWLAPAKAFAQPIQALYNYCTTDTIIASNNIAQYAEDSFFIVAGNTESPGITTFNTYISVLGPDLNLISKKSLYFPGQYNALNGTPHVLLKTGTDKYLLSGMEIDVHTTYHAIHQPFFYFFNHDLDSLGFIKYTDSPRSRVPVAMIQDKQKNIVVTGQISGYSYTIYDPLDANYDSEYVWIAKYDSNAHLLWEKQIFGDNNGATGGFDISMANDSSGYVISGYANENTRNANNFIIRTDSAGNLMWKKFLQRPYEAWAMGMDHILSKDGNYAFVSSYTDTPTPPPQLPLTSYFYYGKLNDLGDTLWTKHVRFNGKSGNVWGEHLTEDANGDLLLDGEEAYYTYYPVLLKTDSNGNPKSYKQYFYRPPEDNISQGFSSFSITNDKRLLFSGYVKTTHKIPGIYDTAGTISWFVLTDTNGCLTPGCPLFDTIYTPVAVKAINTLSPPLQITLFPNPAHNILNIKTGAIDGALNAVMKDITGRTILTRPLTGNNTETISMQQLLPGFYTVQLWQNGQVLKVFKVSHW